MDCRICQTSTATPAEPGRLLRCARKGCQTHPGEIYLSDARFCMHCGRPLEHLAVPACTGCGQRKVGKFCLYCGHPHEGLMQKSA